MIVQNEVFLAMEVTGSSYRGYAYAQLCFFLLKRPTLMKSDIKPF